MLLLDVRTISSPATADVAEAELSDTDLYSEAFLKAIAASLHNLPRREGMPRVVLWVSQNAEQDLNRPHLPSCVTSAQPRPPHYFERHYNKQLGSIERVISASPKWV